MGHSARGAFDPVRGHALLEASQPFRSNAPPPARLSVQPTVELNLGPGRVEVNLEAKLTQLSGRSYHVEFDIPTELQITRVDGEGVTDWSRSAGQLSPPIRWGFCQAALRFGSLAGCPSRMTRSRRGSHARRLAFLGRSGRTSSWFPAPSESQRLPPFNWKPDQG